MLSLAAFLRCVQYGLIELLAYSRMVSGCDLLRCSVVHTVGFDQILICFGELSTYPKYSGGFGADLSRYSGVGGDRLERHESTRVVSVQL